jgi:hypothetical protein
LIEPLISTQGSQLSLAALSGLLVLTVRVLLLLTGLLAAALLLARLLTGCLVLLAWILVLIGHSRSPFFKVARFNLARRSWLLELWFQIRPPNFAKPQVPKPLGALTEKTPMYKPLQGLLMRLPP